MLLFCAKLGSKKCCACKVTHNISFKAFDVKGNVGFLIIDVSNNTLFTKISPYFWLTLIFLGQMLND